MDFSEMNKKISGEMSKDFSRPASNYRMLFNQSRDNPQYGWQQKNLLYKNHIQEINTQ